MTSITTKLTTSGNSTAVRLPKALLQMSGLGKVVTLQAQKGRIIIKNSQDPRAGWSERIAKDIAKYGPPNMVDEYGDMMLESEATLGDGLK